MKKIGLVTFYKSYNYGAWLQAYATLKFLLLNGYDAEIIAYSNSYEESKLRYSYKEGNRNIGYITSFLKSLLYGKVRYYKKGFKRHLMDYYVMTTNYNNVEDMKNLRYDVLVVGSDQVWNPEITNGLDNVFMLQFGKAEKRISIASSLGSKELSDKDRNLLVSALNKFDAISVREDFAKKILQDHVHKNIKVISDPTFLLTKELWIDNLAKKSRYHNTKEKYLLIYFVSKEKSTAKCQELISEYSKELELPVWSIQFSSYFSSGVDKKILGASIADFIALVSNAELVITDSFHGTAISLNLEKDFITYQNSENPVRTQYLLSNLGLSNRINMSLSKYETVDYKAVSAKIQEMRNDSQNWVLGEIEKNNG